MSLEKCIFAPGIATLPYISRWIIPKSTRRAAGYGGSFSCRLWNITPPGGIARTPEVVFDGIGKDIGFTDTAFFRVLL